MAVGTVKTIFEDKGYGFIEAANGPDIFFHFKALDPAIEFGPQMRAMTVEYETEFGPNGKVRAKSVRPHR